MRRKGPGSSDPFSTPARRRRIIAEFVKPTLRSYLITACYNVHRFRIETAASIVIQCCWRAYFARKTLYRLQLAKRNRAATRIQTIVRGKLARSLKVRLLRLRHRKRCLKLVAVVEGLVLMKKARLYRIAQQLSRQLQLEKRRQHGALGLQRTYRGYIARTRYRWLRYTRIIWKMKQHLCALRIQTRLRGFLARRWYQRQLQRWRAAQRIGRNVLAWYRALLCARHAYAKVLQLHFRKYLSRPVAAPSPPAAPPAIDEALVQEVCTTLCAEVVHEVVRDLVEWILQQQVLVVVHVAAAVEHWTAQRVLHLLSACDVAQCTAHGVLLGGLVPRLLSTGMATPGVHLHEPLRSLDALSCPAPDLEGDARPHAQPGGWCVHLAPHTLVHVVGCQPSSALSEEVRGSTVSAVTRMDVHRPRGRVLCVLSPLPPASPTRAATPPPEPVPIPAPAPAPPSPPPLPDRHPSARILQRRVRVFLAVCRVAHRRRQRRDVFAAAFLSPIIEQALCLAAHRQAAAVCVQSVWRRWMRLSLWQDLVCSLVHILHLSATVLQCSVRRWLAGRSYRRETAREHMPYGHDFAHSSERCNWQAFGFVLDGGDPRHAVGEEGACLRGPPPPACPLYLCTSSVFIRRYSSQQVGVGGAATSAVCAGFTQDVLGMVDLPAPPPGVVNPWQHDMLYALPQLHSDRLVGELCLLHTQGQSSAREGSADSVFSTTFLVSDCDSLCGEDVATVYDDIAQEATREDCAPLPPVYRNLAQRDWRYVAEGEAAPRRGQSDL